MSIDQPMILFTIVMHISSHIPKHNYIAPSAERRPPLDASQSPKHRLFFQFIKVGQDQVKPGCLTQSFLCVASPMHGGPLVKRTDRFLKLSKSAFSRIHCCSAVFTAASLLASWVSTAAVCAMIPANSLSKSASAAS